MKGQIVADFIVGHAVIDEEGMQVVEVVPRKMFFDGSVCSKGQGRGCIFISPNGLVIDICVR
jgi:hypothetical protein